MVLNMNPFKPDVLTGPEAKIEERLIKTLRGHEWFVKKLHGNAFQSGLPDLFCAHAKYGSRLVEVKYKDNYSFTKAQQQDFPALMAHGVGIWILVDNSSEELLKLFKPPNWQEYYLRWLNGVK
jgi:hypothetical protein